MVSTIDEARTPAELAEWLRVWADGYEEGVDYLDDNDARQLAVAVERVCTPCNAAAMRAALEHVCHMDDNGYTTYDVRVAMQKASAALAAPARICDRFKNAEEAEEAFVKFCGFAMNGKIPYWKCPPNCGHTGPDGWVTCCIRWLFAPAEGGDHA